MCIRDRGYSTTQETIQSVYLHLAFLEDLLAIFEDHPMGAELAETWMAVRWTEQNDDWKRLARLALFDSAISYEETSPQYERPSLFTLSHDWMKEMGYDDEVAERVPELSLTFREEVAYVRRSNANEVWEQVYPEDNYDCLLYTSPSPRDS